ncbi:MAG: ATP-binding protein, partial [Prolixibacteraceae bacterium]
SASNLSDHREKPSGGSLQLLSNYVKKRRAYESGLQQARTEAENLARAKEQFAANVSHEMRTPVNAIYGLAEQLLRRKNNENLDEQISVLAQSSHHLNQMINDTLDFTKVQTGKLRFNAVHFSPEQVFHEIYSLQKFSALQKGISLELEVDKNLPKALIGDPLRLKQILINLLGNAIKFTKEGKVVFHAKASETQNGKIDLQMQVADTGIGIPKEDQQKVFEEFVQAENREGKKYRGTGLGLAIVKKLTELQNGKIDLESEPGTGTTVRLSIPYPKGNTEKIEKAETGVQEIPGFIKQLRVLVADDEEFNRFVLQSLFNKWNIQFREAKNGEEAVQLAISEDFDIVMMDVRMPKKNGIQATKEILNARPDTKIIAITATENIQEKQQCIDAGVAAFLPKPFSEEQLFAAIHSSVNKQVIKEKQKKNEPALAELKKMAGNDYNFLKEMITLFIRTAENGLAEISAAIKKRNRQEIADAAHKIAPQCKQMRQMQLYDKIKELEKIAENEPADIEKMSNLFSQINDNISAINRELRDYLKQMEKTG